MNICKVRNLTIGQGIPKICVPIVGKTKEEILAEATEIKNTPAQIVEWRGDFFQNIFNYNEIDEVLEELSGILNDLPVLFTFRTNNEGGAMYIDPEKYLELYSHIIKTGYADLIDVEYFFNKSNSQTDSKAFSPNLLYPSKLISLAHDNNVKVILSNHDIHKTPEKDIIVSTLKKMQSTGSDITKMAVMPNSKSDVLTLLDATTEMKEKYATKPLITVSMSKEGFLSRCTGEIFGSAITYASLKNSSAPGQINVNRLYEIIQSIHTAIH